MSKVPRPNSPGEAANLAWVISDGLLNELAQYCQNPTDARDVGRDFTDLIGAIEKALERLENVANLRTQGVSEHADSDLLAAVDRSDDVVVLVHTRTFAQDALGTESELTELRIARGEANAN
jgi:hypothetical protein